MLTFASLLIASQAASPATPVGRDWITCSFRQIQRLYEDQATAESVTDSALLLCERQYQTYWAAMHRQYITRAVADPIQSTNLYMTKRKAELRADLLATVLDMRAVMRGKP